MLSDGHCRAMLSLAHTAQRCFTTAQACQAALTNTTTHVVHCSLALRSCCRRGQLRRGAGGRQWASHRGCLGHTLVLFLTGLGLRCLDLCSHRQRQASVAKPTVASLWRRRSPRLHRNNTQWLERLLGLPCLPLCTLRTWAAFFLSLNAPVEMRCLRCDNPTHRGTAHASSLAAACEQAVHVLQLLHNTWHHCDNGCSTQCG